MQIASFVLWLGQLESCSFKGIDNFQRNLHGMGCDYEFNRNVVTISLSTHWIHFWCQVMWLLIFIEKLWLSMELPEVFCYEILLMSFWLWMFAFWLLFMFGKWKIFMIKLWSEVGARLDMELIWLQKIGILFSKISLNFDWKLVNF